MTRFKWTGVWRAQSNELIVAEKRGTHEKKFMLRNFFIFKMLFELSCPRLADR